MALLSHIFAHPTVFDPDRFAPPREEHKKNPYTLVGFGSGPRICIGINFAQVEIKAMIQFYEVTGSPLHGVFRNFQWFLYHEGVVTSLPQLNQFAIISRPDERLGERSSLIATLRSGQTVSLAEIVAHLASKEFAKYKWPEELILADELLSMPTGKVARARLAQVFQNTPEWGTSSS